MEQHPVIDWPPAPAWSFTVGDIGRNAIYAAIALCLVSFLLNLLSKNRPAWTNAATWTFVLGACGFFVAIASLGILFAKDQFHYTYVFGHSDATAELKYKIAAIWGGQEGSFLLWACASALFGILSIRAVGNLRRWYLMPYAIFLAALGGILAYESPFLTEMVDGKYLLPPTGMGLAPSLLNYWVTIHPPTIFLGFGSLTVLFCWALAALAAGDVTGWVRGVRPWSIVSMSLVGIGLCMGGFWAYETLGWGGFWMWDPVENVSFVPWAISVAFVHGVFIQIAKGRWVFANLLLAAAPFITFAYGTFLTRSGFLGDTSVHSFAQMNRTALWLLVGLGSAAILSFFGLWIYRWRTTKLPADPKAGRAGYDRGSFYAAGVWFLCGLAIACAVGMSWPLISGMISGKAAVIQEAQYHKVVPWLFVPLMIFMSVGPFLGWRKLGIGEVIVRAMNVFLISLGLVGLFLLWVKLGFGGMRYDPESKIQVVGLELGNLGWVSFLVWLCLFAILASGWKMVEVGRRALPSLGGFLAHVGIAVLMLGLIVSRGLEQKAQIVLQEGRPAEGIGYKVEFVPPDGERDFRSRSNTVAFKVTSERESFVAHPGYYVIERPGQEPQTMVWPFIHGTPFYDVYFTLHPMSSEATDQIEFKEGETKLLDDTQITYASFRRQGEAGMAGTKFIAKIVLKTAHEEYTAEPAIVIGGAGGPEFEMARLGPDYLVSFDRMDAATKTATIQLHYVNPLMPVELYFKPLTILVWLGAGIMVLGGFTAAWYRRTRQRTVPDRDIQPDSDDAPSPTS